MNKNTIVRILTKLKNKNITLDECIVLLEEHSDTDELLNELDMLYEIESEQYYNKKLEDLILSIDMDTNTRSLTHKDLRDTSLIKPETVDSLNEIIRNILKESQ